MVVRRENYGSLSLVKYQEIPTYSGRNPILDIEKTMYAYALRLAFCAGTKALPASTYFIGMQPFPDLNERRGKEKEMRNESISITLWDSPFERGNRHTST